MATVMPSIQHCFCFGRKARVPRACDPSFGSRVIRACGPSLYSEADSSPAVRVTRAPRDPSASRDPRWFHGSLFRGCAEASEVKSRGAITDVQTIELWRRVPRGRLPKTSGRVPRARVKRACDPSLGSRVTRACDPSLCSEVDSSPAVRVTRAPRDPSASRDQRWFHGSSLRACAKAVEVRSRGETNCFGR